MVAETAMFEGLADCSSIFYRLRRRYPVDVSICLTEGSLEVQSGGGRRQSMDDPRKDQANLSTAIAASLRMPQAA